MTLPARRHLRATLTRGDNGRRFRVLEGRQRPPTVPASSALSPGTASKRNGDHRGRIHRVNHDEIFRKVTSVAAADFGRGRARRAARSDFRNRHLERQKLRNATFSRRFLRHNPSCRRPASVRRTARKNFGLQPSSRGGANEKAVNVRLSGALKKVPSC